jgi:peptidoglycan/xylan/chitin deacetylase (PgdA/CDA1 family)
MDAGPQGHADAGPQERADTGPEGRADTGPEERADTGPEDITETWPEGTRAAVSLTYDDGLDSQLALALPALARAELRATFFIASFPGVDHDWALPNATDPLSERHLAWQSARAAGHELAAHSVNHPCSVELNPGQPAGFRLVDYDGARMEAELDDNLLRLARLGAEAPVSFAYPCESDRIGIGAGQAQFTDLVRARFSAVRGSRPGLADPRTVSLHDVPVVDALGMSSAALIARVDEAVAQGAWVVLLFHGVGEARDCPDLSFRPEECAINYLVTPAAAHDDLLAHLASQRATIWTAPFGEVARHLSARTSP